MNETIKEAASTILDQAVTFDIDILAINKGHAYLQKKGLLKTKKKFILRPLTLGTLTQISKRMLEIDLESFKGGQLLEANYKILSQHGRTVAEIVALAVANRKAGAPRGLVDFLLHNLTPKELLTVLNLVHQQMDLRNFMSSIISMRGLNVLESPVANAQNAGTNPTEQGS